MKRIFQSVGVIVLTSFLGACGAAKDWKEIDVKGVTEAHCLRTEDNKTVTCDVSSCEPDGTVFARVGEKLIAPLATCPPSDEDPSVTFEETIPGLIDIVCVGSDTEHPVLLAKDFGDAPTAPAGEGAGGTTSGNDTGGDIITPTDPGSGTSGSGAGGEETTGGGTTGGTAGSIFQLTPTITKAVLTSAPSSVKATANFAVRFGLVNVAWTVAKPADEIEDMYLWSINDFNRMTGKDGYDGTPACGLNEKRYLIVDPATGLNYNTGSPNANAVGGQLEGKACDNTNADTSDDCAGLDPASYSGVFPCRIDLKKDGQWLRMGSVATIPGGTGIREYFLVIKTKGGAPEIQKTAVTVPQPAITAIGGQPIVSVNGSNDEAPSYDVKFHYENADARWKPSVDAQGGDCTVSAGEPSAAGKGDYSARCKLKAKNSFRLVAQGLSNSQHAELVYNLDLGTPLIGLTEPLPSYFTGTGESAKSLLAYGVTRPWTLTDANANVVSSGDLNSIHSVGSVYLKAVHGFLSDTLVTQEEGTKTPTFKDVGVNHRDNVFVLHASELGAGTHPDAWDFESTTSSYVFKPKMDVKQVGQTSCGTRMEIDAAKDWGCGDSCPLYPFVDSFSENFIVTVRDLKSIDVDCQGAYYSLAPSVPALNDPKSYDAQVLTLNVKSGKIDGQVTNYKKTCTIKAVTYDGVSTFTTSMENSCSVVVK